MAFRISLFVCSHCNSFSPFGEMNFSFITTKRFDGMYLYMNVNLAGFYVTYEPTVITGKKKRATCFATLLQRRCAFYHPHSNLSYNK